MDDTTAPDEQGPDNTAQVPAADAASPEVVGDGTSEVPAGDAAPDSAGPGPAARSARRKLWTVAAAAAAVGAVGGVALGAVGAEVLDEGRSDDRDDSAQGWDHDRHDREQWSDDEDHGGRERDDWSGGQGDRPQGVPGGNWGPGGGHSRSGGS